MKKNANVMTMTICLVLPAILYANSSENLYNYRTRPIGELSAVRFKIEQGPITLFRTDIVGVGQYFGKIGIGLDFFRYMEAINNNNKLPQGYAMVEWLPVRISYIPYLVRAKYKGTEWEYMENEPFFIWNSVTPYEYAKIYFRFYLETSYRQVVHKAPAYPFVLTGGFQVNWGLLSTEIGYRHQDRPWHVLQGANPYVNRQPLDITGFYISANVNIGAIFTRTIINN